MCRSVWREGNFVKKRNRKSVGYRLTQAVTGIVSQCGGVLFNSNSNSSPQPLPTSPPPPPPVPCLFALPYSLLFSLSLSIYSLPVLLHFSQISFFGCSTVVAAANGGEASPIVPTPVEEPKSKPKPKPKPKAKLSL